MSVSPEPGIRADKRLHQLAPDASASTHRCQCSTATLSSPAGDIVVLRVAGEVDLGSFAVLDAALDDVLDRRPDHLIVDLTGLVFCSCRGLTAITQTVRAAAAQGIRYSISGASPLFSRLWPHYWPDGDVPRIHRTTADAVLAALVLQADQWTPLPTADIEQQHPLAGQADGVSLAPGDRHPGMGAGGPGCPATDHRYP
jgi:anti-anti-sigma factor